LYRQIDLTLYLTHFADFFYKLRLSACYMFKYVMKEHMESTVPRIVLITDVKCVTMWTDPARVYLDGPGRLATGIVSI
jgi:hypothetical protein